MPPSLDERLSPVAAAEVRRWRTDPLLAEHRPAVEALLAGGDWEAVEDAFGRVLPFGTAGRRGPEGVGPNRLNTRTIAESAAGLAQDVLAQPALPRRAVIGFDMRRRSAEYARLAAETMVALGLEVLLFDEPCATPQLAFEVQRRGAGCGAMITASHNPPGDNGFKAYGPHGGQVVPPQDRRIIDRVMALAGQPLAPVGGPRGSLRHRGLDEDSDYLAYVASQACGRSREARLVFSPLHGVGGRTVLPVLRRAGFGELHLVPQESVRDPDFGELPGGLANPESPPALAGLVARLRELDADAGCASDPDADRLGFAARDPHAPGGYRIFGGNQLATLIVWQTLQARAASGTLPANGVVLRSVVGAALLEPLCADYGVDLWGDYPIGFKWFGQTCAQVLGERPLLAAVDESHGFNRGALVRDKDAASAALALAELVADARADGRTVSDLWAALEARYGLCEERVVSRRLAARDEASRLLARLREDPPARLAGLAVERVEDRAAEPWLNPATGQPQPEEFLLLHLDRARLGVRASGTEPKLKLYVMARGRARADLLELVEELPAALLSL